jgi:general nucleoside transport system ATP-binding protein
MLQTSNTGTVLQGTNLVKRFGDLVAVNDVSVSVRKGEIGALLGENGAGKSTCLKLLNGFLKPTSGTIIYENQKITFSSAHEAAKKGIYTIYQNFALIDKFTVKENLILAFPNKSESEIKGIASRYGKALDLNVRVALLPAGVKQKLEITKALASDAKVLLLDEPTSVLAYEERDILFKDLAEMRDEKGIAILIATHKLQDVINHCDRVTVMKGGRVVMEKLVGETKMSDLTAAMFGTAEEFHAEEETKGRNEEDRILDVADISVKGDSVPLAVSHATFSLYRGKVLGIIGVAGNGQIELADAVIRLRRLAAGRIIPSKRLLEAGTKLRIGRIGYISDDPVQVGLAVDLSVRDNFGISAIDQVSKGQVVDWNSLDQFSEAGVNEFGIKCSSLDTLLRDLSGGNIQKVSVARELKRNLDVLLAVHPARGLDLHTTYLVYKHIRQVADSGVAVLLISEDIDELLDLADDIAVIYEGKLSQTRPKQQWTKQEIGAIMTGAAT